LQVLLWFLGAGALVAAMLVLGLAAAAVVHRDGMSPGEDLMVALGAGIAVPALATVVQLPLSLAYTTASPPLMAFLLLVSFSILWRRRQWVASLVGDEQVRIVAFSAGTLLTLGLAVGALPWDKPSDGAAGTVASFHVPNMPGDALLQYRTAQIVQNRMDISRTDYYVHYWYISDRTPLVGLVTTFMESSAGIHLPTATLDSFNAPFTPIDPYGYWMYRIISMFTNSLVVASAVIAAWALLGSRAAKLGSVLILLSPYIFLDILFHWPKLLVGFFIVGYWFWSYVRVRPVLAGVFAGAAVMSHPVGILFVPGMFLFMLVRRQWRQIVMTAAAAGIVTFPWFFWTGVIYHHMSRLFTYPIGYALNNVTTPWPEIKSDAIAFLNRGPISILHDRWVCLRNTFTAWPLPLDVMTAHGLRAAAFPLYEVYRTSFPGIFGAGLAVFGFGTWKRIFTQTFWAATLGVSTLCVFLFWGFTPRALAQEAFQPGAGLWICLAAALLLAMPSWLIRAVVIISVVEWFPFTYFLVVKTPSPASWHLSELVLVALTFGLVLAVGAVGWGLASGVPRVPPEVKEPEQFLPEPAVAPAV
jgi:hypothetical protein